MFLSFILNSIVTMIWLTFSVVNSQGTDTSNSVSYQLVFISLHSWVFSVFKNAHIMCIKGLIIHSLVPFSAFSCGPLFVFNYIFIKNLLITYSVYKDLRYPLHQVNCKILAVLTQYTSTSTYFWMLCEGIYLHTLIIVAVFVGEQQLFWYYILGWGESGGSNTFMPFPILLGVA